jgi:hypothetical protein
MAVLDRVEAAIRSGDEAGAINLLKEIVAADADCIDAWLWLADLASTTTDKQQYLLQVIAVDPLNGEARRALLRLKRSSPPTVPASNDNVVAINGAAAPRREAREAPHVEPSDAEELLSAPIHRTDNERTSSLPTESSSALTEQHIGLSHIDYRSVDIDTPGTSHGSTPVPAVQLVDALPSTDDVDLTENDDDFNVTDQRPEPPREPAVRRGDVHIAWSRVIRDEDDLKQQLPAFLSKLQSDVAEVAPALRAKLDRITRVLERDRFSWPRLVADASDVAALASEAFLRSGNYVLAAKVANAFAECTKIYAGLNRDTAERLVGRFVAIAVEAHIRTVPDSATVEDTEASLRKLIIAATGQSFDHRQQRWTPHRADRAFMDKTVSNALCRQFDRRLEEITTGDRTRLPKFVSDNMPYLYRLPLEPQWRAARDRWERQISTAGYEDLIRHLKSMGDLLRVDEVGEVSPERREDIRRAADLSEYARARQLLEPAERELRQYLYAEGQVRLRLREPRYPDLPTRELQQQWWRVPKLVRSKTQEASVRAFKIVKEIWESDLNSYELRDWVAYVAALAGNTLVAEELLQKMVTGRSTKPNFVSTWNLAALKARTSDEQRVYETLLPLIQVNATDPDLIMVLLAYSHKLSHFRQFLDLIPYTSTLQLHPLAFAVAVDIRDSRARQLLADLVNHWQSHWQLPHVGTRYNSEKELEQVVTKAIVERQVDQVVAWLRARIRAVPWVPNSRQLARVLENERSEPEAAFDVLLDAVRIISGSPNNHARLAADSTVGDALKLARRTAKPELESRFAATLRANGVPEHVLTSLGVAEEAPEPLVTPGGDSSEVLPPVLNDKPLSQGVDLTWLVAKLTRVNSVARFEQERSASEEFRSALLTMFPTETAHLADWLQDIELLIREFTQLPPDRYAERQVVYGRVAEYEAKLSGLLSSNAVSARLAATVAPYHEALKRVIGDLSRQAGVGPQVKAKALNTFVARGAVKSAIVLQVQNQTGLDGGPSSGRPVSNVQIELRVPPTFAQIVGRRDRTIVKLEAGEVAELHFPFTALHALASANEFTCDVSIKASSEGFPNFDVGIAPIAIPIRTFDEVIGASEIASDFSPGRALAPDDRRLFLGRDEVLTKIAGSVRPSVQRERYFLDGIRRVGKTSIVNFVPEHLPPNTLAVRLSMNNLAICAEESGDEFLRKLAAEVTARYNEAGIELSAPIFDDMKARDVVKWMSQIRTASGRTPVLMFDEFQILLRVIARNPRATIVLDLLRHELEEGSLYGLFTGSVRFDRLSEILKHPIIGNLVRLRISFLNEASVAHVLGSGCGGSVTITDHAARRAWELTGGYPWLLQHLGSLLVELMNDERRTIVGRDDVERVCKESILSNNQLFEYWWPAAVLGTNEERFIELFIQQYGDVDAIPVHDALERFGWREGAAHKTAVDALRACEVFDSTQVNVLRFSAELIREWLKLQIRNGRLQIPNRVAARRADGVVGVYVDHENLYKTLERVAVLSAADRDLENRFLKALGIILKEVERRLARPDERVAVAFWDRPLERRLRGAYDHFEFLTRSPEPVKQSNAADFKLADEVRRSVERVKKTGMALEHLVLITGDADYSHMVRGLINDGLNVHVWGGLNSTAEFLRQLVGPERVMRIEDVLRTQRPSQA